jgi:hypothetical protein
MADANGVTETIATAVESPVTTQDAAQPLPTTVEAEYQAKIAKLNEDINKLKSVKDSETAAERRARLQAEQAKAAAEAQLETERANAWQIYNKYAPEEEVTKAKAEYERQQAATRDQQAQWARWNAWKYEQALEHGISKDEIVAATTPEAVNALIAKKREDKAVAEREAEIEARIMERLKKQGLVGATTTTTATTPKTPVDVGATPGGGTKVTEKDLEAAERAFALNTRNPALKKKYLELTEQYAKENPA